jgi:hypothetical protein
MKLTAELLAMHGLLNTDEYLRLTGDPLLMSEKELAAKKRKSDSVKAYHVRRLAKRRRAQIVTKAHS